MLLELTMLSLLPCIYSGLLSRQIFLHVGSLQGWQEIQGSNHPNLLMLAVPEAGILLELSPHTCCTHSSLCAANPRKKTVFKDGM